MHLKVIHKRTMKKVKDKETFTDKFIVVKLLETLKGWEKHAEFDEEAKAKEEARKLTSEYNKNPERVVFEWKG